jgi:Radial spokehead-like protein
MATAAELRQILKEDSTGKNLYEHLTETLMKIVLERPANAYDMFELISADVKSNPLNPDPEKGKPVPPSPEEVSPSLPARGPQFAPTYPLYPLLTPTDCQTATVGQEVCIAAQGSRGARGVTGERPRLGR